MPKLPPGPALQHANGNALPIMAMTPAGLEPAIPSSVGRCLIHWATGPAENSHLETFGQWQANHSTKACFFIGFWALMCDRAGELVRVCVCVCVCVASP